MSKLREYMKENAHSYFIPTGDHKLPTNCKISLTITCRHKRKKKHAENPPQHPTTLLHDMRFDRLQDVFESPLAQFKCAFNRAAAVQPNHFIDTHSSVFSPYQCKSMNDFPMNRHLCGHFVISICLYY